MPLEMEHHFKQDLESVSALPPASMSVEKLRDYAPRRAPASEWPATARICKCKRVTRGEIDAAIARGSCTINDIQRVTGASTGCGGCLSLVQQLLCAAQNLRATYPWLRAILTLSILAFAGVGAILWAPAAPYASSVQDSPHMDQLWRDGLLKQISGFTLLGTIAAPLLLSLRKRWRKFAFGGFGHWRLAHAALGVLTLAMIFVHTGFRLGSGLNLCLSLSILSVVAIGAVLGAAQAVGRRRAAKSRTRAHPTPTEALWLWLHIFAFWPAPLLICLHILSVYFYKG